MCCLLHAYLFWEAILVSLGGPIYEYRKMCEQARPIHARAIKTGRDLTNQRQERIEMIHKIYFVVWHQKRYATKRYAVATSSLEVKL